MSTNNFNHYNKNLRKFANENRHKMNKAEACLWKYVLRAKMTGYTFNRQRPSLNYITDFMCKELKLIIEADGITHTYEGAAERDKIRQDNLEFVGFTVIRFQNIDILKNIDWVRFEIMKTIKQLEEKKKVELEKAA